MNSPNSLDQKKQPAVHEKVHEKHHHLLHEHNVEHMHFSFDMFAGIAIFASIIIAILDSIPLIHKNIGTFLLSAEWIFTALFTIEYAIRIAFTKKKTSYIFGTAGILDFICLLPMYVALIIPLAQMGQFVRILRLVRITSRFSRLSIIVDALSKNILHPKRHLMNSEEERIFIRKSRRAFFFPYLMLILIFTICVSLATNVLHWAFLDFLVIQIILYIIMFATFLFALKFEISIWSNRYSITTHRITYSKGLLSEDAISLQYRYVTDVSLQQNFWQKILNFGTLTVNSSGDQGSITLQDISHPLDVKKIIQELVHTQFNQENSTKQTPEQ